MIIFQLVRVGVVNTGICVMFRATERVARSASRHVIGARALCRARTRSATLEFKFHRKFLVLTEMKYFKLKFLNDLIFRGVKFS